MKTSGFRASHRNRWQLIQNKTLAPQEFLLLDFYIDQMDFDGYHEKFGTFEVFYDEVAEVLNRSIDSIRIWHKGLVKKGFIEVADKKRHLFRIPSPKRYVVSPKKKGEAYFYSSIEKIVHTPKTLLATINFSQNINENTPENRTDLLWKSTPIALISSKDKSRVIPSNIDSPNTTDKEITEKDICDIIFQGNSDEYYKHLINEFPNY